MDKVSTCEWWCIHRYHREAISHRSYCSQIHRSNCNTPYYSFRQIIDLTHIAQTVSLLRRGTFLDQLQEFHIAHFLYLIVTGNANRPTFLASHLDCIRD